MTQKLGDSALTGNIITSYQSQILYSLGVCSENHHLKVQYIYCMIIMIDWCLVHQQKARDLTFFSKPQYYTPLVKDNGGNIVPSKVATPASSLNEQALLGKPSFLTKFRNGMPPFVSF